MVRGRVKRVAPPAVDADESVSPIGINEFAEQFIHPACVEIAEQMRIPPDWQKGALLNVRNYGAEYIVTLYPEEHDERHPERAMHFTNLGRCQDFVSAWYSREHCDPRAR